MHAPTSGLSGAEAAEILGTSRQAVYRLVNTGVLPKSVAHQHGGLDRDDVERVALERWKPGHPYWITSSEVAQILGVNPARVRQIVARGFLPAVRRGHRWLYRRPQVEVIANARLARRLQQ
jgi:predicted site-specific integrase-resolvase